MSTLSNTARVTSPARALWRNCARCGRLFPAGPGETLCAGCDAAELAGARRCRCAHPDDPSPCEGRPDAVRVVDAVGEQATGCVAHAAVVLACVTDAAVYPVAVAGAAVEVYRRAKLRAPFQFDPSAGSVAGGGR